MTTEIVSTPGTLGGAWRLKDTRMPVSAIKAYHLQGGVDAVLRAYPWLSEKQIADAVAFEPPPGPPVDLDELARLCEAALPPYRLVTGERVVTHRAGEETTVLQDANGMAIADLLSNPDELTEHDALLAALLNAAPTLIPEMRDLRAQGGRYTDFLSRVLEGVQLLASGAPLASEPLDREIWTAVAEKLEAELVEVIADGPPEARRNGAFECALCGAAFEDFAIAPEPHICVECRDARNVDAAAAPYVCPGCHAVSEPCSPGCIDDEMRREHEDAITYGNYERSAEDEDAQPNTETD